METVNRRMWLPIVFEAARVCDEGHVDGPEQIDQALRDGLGMTPVFPGVFEWMNVIGDCQFLERLKTHKSPGNRFEMPEFLAKRLALNADHF